MKTETLFGITLFILLLPACMRSLPAQDNSLPIEGEGSINNPFEINSINDLYVVSQDPGMWDKHFVQLTDIDASETRYWENGSGFSPIGSDNTWFSGSYDGQGFIITGLMINRPDGAQIGLFGHTKNAQLENIVLSNFSIMGESIVGSLVGWCETSIVRTCLVNGSVYANCSDVGGMIGLTNTSQILKCTSDCIVTGLSRVGGLIGKNNDFSFISDCQSFGNIVGNGDKTGGLIGEDKFSTLSNCCSTAQVKGNAQVGGLIGESGFSYVTNCYSTGDVFGVMSLGGLVGSAYDTYLLACCYSNGVVESVFSYGVGGLIGLGSGTMHSNFWDTESSGINNSVGATGKTTAEMKELATFTDLQKIDLESAWDFVGNPFDDNQNEDIWNLNTDVNDGYPYLDYQFILDIPQVTSSELFLYPNPAHEFLMIDFNLIDHVVCYLFNANGHLVKMQPMNHSPSKMDISNLDAGTYFVQLKNNDRIIYSKVVIE